MTSLHPQVAAIETELRAATARARQLVQAVDETRFHARPSPERWSIAECLAHLNLTTEAYLPLVGGAIATGRAANRAAPARYRRDLTGWFLCRMTEPPVRSKIKTPAAFVPQSTGTREQVLEQFEALQAKLVTALLDANGFDLGNLRLASPFAPRLRYSVYSAFRLLPAHQRRHLWQGEQVLALK